MHMFEGLGEKQIQFTGMDNNNDISRDANKIINDLNRNRIFDRNTMVENISELKSRIDNCNLQTDLQGKNKTNDISLMRLNMPIFKEINQNNENLKNIRENKLLLNADKSNNNNLCLKNNLTTLGSINHLNNKQKMYGYNINESGTVFSDSYKDLTLPKKINNEPHRDIARNNTREYDIYPKYQVNPHTDISLKQTSKNEVCVTNIKTEKVCLNEIFNSPKSEENNDTIKMQEDIDLFMHFIKDVKKKYHKENNYIRENERPMYYKYKRDDIHDTLCLISESSAFGSDGNEQFSCSFCNMKYTYRRCLMNHIKKKHRNSVK